VNVLGEDDEAISNRFARRREGSRTDFDDCSVETTADGVPIIAGCLAHLECRVVDIHEAGDHRIFVGAVERCRANADAKALIFFRGRYRSLTPWMRTPLADPSHLDYPLCSL
jgi:flavin reductase (DIM6/NTAB) family NADH-FMN oxidoreductase RutF